VYILSIYVDVVLVVMSRMAYKQASVLTVASKLVKVISFCYVC